LLSHTGKDLRDGGVFKLHVGCVDNVAICGCKGDKIVHKHVEQGAVASLDTTPVQYHIDVSM